MIVLISSLMSSGSSLVVTACFPIKMSPIRHNLTDCPYALGFSIGDCNIYEELYLPSPFNMYFTGANVKEFPCLHFFIFLYNLYLQRLPHMHYNVAVEYHSQNNYEQSEQHLLKAREMMLIVSAGQEDEDLAKVSHQQAYKEKMSFEMFTVALSTSMLNIFSEGKCHTMHYF